MNAAVNAAVSAGLSKALTSDTGEFISFKIDAHGVETCDLGVVKMHYDFTLAMLKATDFGSVLPTKKDLVDFLWKADSRLGNRLSSPLSTQSAKQAFYGHEVEKIFMITRYGKRLCVRSAHSNDPTSNELKREYKAWLAETMASTATPCSRKTESEEKAMSTDPGDGAEADDCSKESSHDSVLGVDGYTVDSSEVEHVDAEHTDVADAESDLSSGCVVRKPPMLVPTYPDRVPLALGAPPINHAAQHKKNRKRAIKEAVIKRPAGAVMKRPVMKRPAHSAAGPGIIKRPTGSACLFMHRRKTEKGRGPGKRDSVLFQVYNSETGKVALQVIAHNLGEGLSNALAHLLARMLSEDVELSEVPEIKTALLKGETVTTGGTSLSLKSLKRYEEMAITQGAAD